MDRLSHLNFSFSVSKNKLRSEGARILAEALNVNTSMTYLDVSSNYIGMDENYNSDMTGVKAIADALSVSTSMTSLK